jgi:hypothetical protein
MLRGIGKRLLDQNMIQINLSEIADKVARIFDFCAEEKTNNKAQICIGILQ